MLAYACIHVICYNIGLFFKITSNMFRGKSSTLQWIPTLPPTIMNAYLNLHFLRLFSRKLQPFWPIWFWVEHFKRFFFFIFLCKKKTDPALGLQPIVEEHDLNKLGLIPPEGASTQVTVFLANWFLRRRVLYFFLLKLSCNNSTLNVPQIYALGSWFK